MGLYTVLRKVKANAYILDLPEGVGINPILNVVDLQPYPLSLQHDIDDATPNISNDIPPFDSPEENSSH